jgi:hypothetical protein
MPGRPMMRMLFLTDEVHDDLIVPEDSPPTRQVA